MWYPWPQGESKVATVLLIARRGWLVIGVQVEGKERTALIY